MGAKPKPMYEANMKDRHGSLHGPTTASHAQFHGSQLAHHAQSRVDGAV